MGLMLTLRDGMAKRTFSAPADAEKRSKNERQIKACRNRWFHNAAAPAPISESQKSFVAAMHLRAGEHFDRFTGALNEADEEINIGQGRCMEFRGST
jgi:hypothetical protein